MLVEERTITVRLGQGSEGFIYTVWSEGRIEYTNYVDLEVDGVGSDGEYFGGSQVMD